MSDRTILYVEDNEFNRKIVRDLLARRTYRLVEAIDGEMGVATARQELPDLIIMDIQLPKLSGLDATRALRADPRTAHIPIIVITSFALSGDEQQAREAGASAYLAKPWPSPTVRGSSFRRFGSSRRKVDPPTSGPSPRSWCTVVLAPARGRPSARTARSTTAHDVALPQATRGGKLGFFMYPQAETQSGRLDSLDPDNCKYTITSREVSV